jgi:hypothetical protein
LIDDKLGVPSNLEAWNAYLESDLEPVEDCFVLSDIVGYWEVESDYVFHVHAQGRDENKSGPSSFLREGSVEVHDPRLVFDRHHGWLDLCPFGNEVGEDLGLDGGARGIGDTLPHQLQSPFCDSSFCLWALDTSLSRYFETTMMGRASK